jgi:cell division transport system permease protein
MRGNRRRKNPANQHAPRRSLRLDVWALRHLQVALASLGRLSRAPLSSLMTAAVIGIALALPTGLHLLLNNVQQLSGSWDGAASISLFLKAETDLEQAQDLAAKLRLRTDVGEVNLIDRKNALEEFRQLSGFSGALDSLDTNPLPHLLVVVPSIESSNADSAQLLLKELKQINQVDFAQLDLQWVKRFQGITRIVQRGVMVLATLLALAVLLIVGNTIRLEIQNRHAEIEITKLIGGTDAFIRRPFLYSGLWYGLSGGLIAWALVTLSLWLLAGPVANLAGLYDSGFDLSGMDLLTFAWLLLGSGLLGLGGSWVAVARHLNQIEPS